MKWYSVKDAAPIIGLSVEAVYLICARGRIAHRRVGIKPGRGKIQISDEAIAAYLKSCEVPVAPQGGTGQAPTKKRPKTPTISGRPDGKPIRRNWG